MQLYRTSSPNKYSYYTLHCTGDDGTVVRQGATVATNTAPQAKLAAVSEFVITRESFNKVSIRIAAPVTGAIYSVSINGVQYSFTIYYYVEIPAAGERHLPPIGVYDET